MRARRSVAGADRHLLADLEVRDRLLGAAHARSLASDRRQLLGRGLQHLGVLLGLADPHVEVIFCSVGTAIGLE